MMTNTEWRRGSLCNETPIERMAMVEGASTLGSERLDRSCRGRQLVEEDSTMTMMKYDAVRFDAQAGAGLKSCLSKTRTPTTTKILPPTGGVDGLSFHLSKLDKKGGMNNSSRNSNATTSSCSTTHCSSDLSSSEMSTSIRRQNRRRRTRHRTSDPSMIRSQSPKKGILKRSNTDPDALQKIVVLTTEVKPLRKRVSFSDLSRWNVQGSGQNLESLLKTSSSNHDIKKTGEEDTMGGKNFRWGSGGSSNKSKKMPASCTKLPNLSLMAKEVGKYQAPSRPRRRGSFDDLRKA